MSDEEEKEVVDREFVDLFYEYLARLSKFEMFVLLMRNHVSCIADLEKKGVCMDRAKEILGEASSYIYSMTQNQDSLDYNGLHYAYNSCQIFNSWLLQDETSEETPFEEIENYIISNHSFSESYSCKKNRKRKKN